MVLMAVCDTNYCFSLIDTGQYGSNNDSGVLAAIHGQRNESPIKLKDIQT